MKLLNLNKKIFLILISSFFSMPLFSEDSVDIWKNKNLKKKEISTKTGDLSLEKKKTRINIKTKNSKDTEIKSRNLNAGTSPIYGLFDPSENNLTLEMWTNSEGTRVKDTIDRINKIKLSSFSEKLFVNTLFTISKLPAQNMTDEEFINYKIDWLINNQKNEMISDFLNKNKNFPNKSRIIKYLVDENIAKANLKEACKKITLIDSAVKDSYLDQFNVICLINENKKDEAQLLIDLIREQKLSNKFFNNKINYLLGLSNKVDQKIDDSTLLNFYLSSISISDFNYKPNKQTSIKIWQYLASANLISINDFENNEQIKELEIVANRNRLARSLVLDVYKNIKFSFNDLLNTDVVYLTLDPTKARALVYQKILLSDNIEIKLKYLFLLNDLFKNDKLPKVFKNYLSKELKNLDSEKIPLEYQALVAENIIIERENKLGKIKYNEKSYHTSKVIKYYVENNITKKNIEKELLKVHKRLKKNKKYKISLKDVILLESLKADGFFIPKEINYENIIKNNLPPTEILNLIKNNEIGLALLRIVELVGEDSLIDLDHQTIYIINYLFEKAGLIKLRNNILITLLPDRAET